MQWRYTLAHLILAIVMVLVLTLLMVCVDAQAQIAFSSDRKGDLVNIEIYVMDADGGNQQRLTNNRHDDINAAWLNSPFSVSPAGKKFTMWGWLKQGDR